MLDLEITKRYAKRFFERGWLQVIRAARCQPLARELAANPRTSRTKGCFQQQSPAPACGLPADWPSKGQKALAGLPRPFPGHSVRQLRENRAVKIESLEWREENGLPTRRPEKFRFLQGNRLDCENVSPPRCLGMNPTQKPQEKKKVEGQNRLPKNQPKQPNTKHAPDDRNRDAQYESKDGS